MEEPSSAIVHFYRAIVLHADVWRERLDNTTNWAVVTTIGVISFAFSQPESPHFILLFVVVAGWIFLVMESRRYQVYDLWRRRIRSINQYVVAPRLAPDESPSADEVKKGLRALARDLGRAVPHLRFIDALGYRIRRNYGFIFIFSVGSWVMKLFLHPDEAQSGAQVMERAAVGGISGTAVMSITAVVSLIILFLALRAPSEQMVSWRRLPSPLDRLKRGSLSPAATSDRQERKDPYIRPGPRAPRPLSEFLDEDELGAGDDSDETDSDDPKKPDGSDDSDDSQTPDDSDDSHGPERQKSPPPNNGDDD